MNKVRFKQRKLFKAVKILTVLAAVFIFVYIGVQPYVSDYSRQLALALNYICNALVIAVLTTLFIYFSRYGKCDSFLNAVENEINDAGCYLTSRSQRGSDLADVIGDDLKNCGYLVSRNVEVNEFDFSIKATKGRQLMYIASIDNADKNDVVAHIDSVINDLTTRTLKRKADAVLCIITDTAKPDAVALSKMITPLGRREQIKIALAICENDTGRVYFLGNVQTKCSCMIANFVMNCDVPIKEQYICREKLPFQKELEEKMKTFTLKSFNNGSFYVH